MELPTTPYMMEHDSFKADDSTEADEESVYSDVPIHFLQCYTESTDSTPGKSDSSSPEKVAQALPLCVGPTLTLQKDTLDCEAFDGAASPATAVTSASAQSTLVPTASLLAGDHDTYRSTQPWELPEGLHSLDAALQTFPFPEELAKAQDETGDPRHGANVAEDFELLDDQRRRANEAETSCLNQLKRAVDSANEIAEQQRKARRMELVKSLKNNCIYFGGPGYTSIMNELGNELGDDEWGELIE